MLLAPFLWHVSVVKTALWYNVVLLAAFLLLYFLIDFEHHFDFKRAPGGGRHNLSPSGKVYFALMTHTGVGSNDIVPRTDFARRAMSAHALLAWMQILVVFLH